MPPGPLFLMSLISMANFRSKNVGKFGVKSPCVMNTPDSPSFLLVDWTPVATDVHTALNYLASVSIAYGKGISYRSSLKNNNLLSNQNM